jgi:hypothetical protein
MYPPEPGDRVTYYDGDGTPRKAVVVYVWDANCVNLAYASSDPGDFSRGVAEDTSVVYATDENPTYAFERGWDAVDGGD